MTGRAHSPQDRGIIERYNNTIKTRINKYFTATGSNKWVTTLQDFTKAINNETHRITKVTPVQAVADPSSVQPREVTPVATAKKNIDEGDKVTKEMPQDGARNYIQLQEYTQGKEFHSQE